MEFTVERSELGQALALASKAVPSKSPKPIMEMIYLEAKGDKVYVRGTNSVLDITAWCKADVKTEGRCCVNNLLAETFGTFADGEVKFKLGKTLSLSQGKSRNRRFAVADVDQYPLKPSIKGKHVDTGVPELLDALSMASIALSDRADMPATRGYYINPHDGTLITADGNQVFMQKGLQMEGNISLPVGAYLTPLLSDLKRSEVKVNLSYPWMSLRSSSFQVCINSPAEFDKYPPVAELMEPFFDENTKPSLVLTVNVPEIKALLEGAVRLSDRASGMGRLHHLAVDRSNGEVRFQMDAQDIGGIDDIIDCQAEGVEEFRILLHPKLLLEVFSLPMEKAEMWFYRPEDEIVVCEPGANYRYVQVAMSLDERAQQIQDEPEPQAETELVAEDEEEDDY